MNSTNESLEEFVLTMMVLPLGVFMLMFSNTLLISQGLDMVEVEAKRFVFVISLLGATIHNNGIKERSDTC